jgi:hypothetical protein
MASASFMAAYAFFTPALFFRALNTASLKPAFAACVAEAVAVAAASGACVLVNDGETAGVCAAVAVTVAVAAAAGCSAAMTSEFEKIITAAAIIDFFVFIASPFFKIVRVPKILSKEDSAVRCPYKNRVFVGDSHLRVPTRTGYFGSNNTCSTLTPYHSTLFVEHG